MSTAIRDLLLDRTMLESDVPEYVALLREHFADLNSADQTTLIGMIENRPAPIAYASGASLNDPEEGAKWVRSWQARLFAAIADHLPGDVLGRHPEIARLRSEPVISDEDFERLSGWVGDRGAIDVQAILAMSVDDLLAHVGSWTPPRRIDGPTIEGQANVLSEAVTKDPPRFASRASEFISLDPTYVRALFRGFEQAVKDQRAFAWPQVFALARAVLTKPAENTSSGFDRDPGWSWSRKAIIDLIRESLSPTLELDLQHRADVWYLIEQLAGDPDPSGLVGPDVERDAMTASINKIASSALHAAVEYALWVRRKVDPTSRATSTLAPEVFELLERHAAEDETIEARGALGFRFGQLMAIDEAWTTEHVPEFFPADDERVANVTWQAYVYWNSARDDIVKQFPPLYVAAAKRIRPQRREREHVDVDEALARHLALAYMRGVITLDSEHLVAFYTHAPARVRAQLIGEIGRLLAATVQLEDEHCTRARDLWTSRRDSAVAAPIAERREELEQFGHWFTSGKCGDDWLLQELVNATELAGSIEPDSRVVEQLVEIASVRPMSALEVVENLIRAPKERWFLDMHRKQIHDIVAAGDRSSDATAATKAKAIAQTLLTVGLMEFEPLAR